jgi:hypothetical protein
MSGSKTLIHILEILSVFACAHHFWPKGVTYGEEEEWEKAQKKKRERRKQKRRNEEMMRSRSVGRERSNSRVGNKKMKEIEYYGNSGSRIRNKKREEIEYYGEGYGRGDGGYGYGRGDGRDRDDVMYPR